MRNFLKIIAIAPIFFVGGCATITNDAHQPIAMSLSDGSSGTCDFKNKRMQLEASIPGTVSIRRSDDLLHYDCKTNDGRIAKGSIASKMGAKIVASALFLDFGIVDSITDKHREYPVSFVIPIAKADTQ